MTRTVAIWTLLAVSPLRALAQMDAPPPAGSPDEAHQADVILDGDPTLTEDPSAAGIDPTRRRAIDAAIRSRDYERAEALLLEVLEAHPQSAEALRMLGGIFFVRGQHLNAAVLLEKAEAIAPLDERSRFTLVMSYVVLGRRDLARAELETLTTASPRNPLYLYWTARIDYDEGKNEAAVERLLRVVELDPGFIRAWDNLGLNYEALGRFEEALQGYEEALRLNREARTPSPWPPLNLGLLLIKLEQLEEAEAHLRESVGADASFPQGHYQLGVLLDKTGRSAEAISELEEAARLDDDYAEPHFALARLYRKAGEQEKARQALARFQEIKREKGEQ